MKKNYIVISPVHNEQKYIEAVIECILSQTIRPKFWVISNDASTDATGQIIDRFAAQYDFIIHYQTSPVGTHSYYSRRTRAFVEGYKRVQSTEHDFVAALDADLTFDQTYYQSILHEFDNDPRLGVASGVYVNEVNGKLQKVVRAEISTPGGLQMFRRECYQDIGGYSLMKYGGDDSLADIVARMKGWRTRSFEQYKVIHHRPTGTRNSRTLVAKYRQGLAEYSIGTHPLFMLAKSFRRIFIERPFLLASTARLAGFLYASATGLDREIRPQVLKYVRNEQTGRLLSCLGFPRRKDHL